MQLTLTEEGATALEEVLDDALFQLRAQVSKAGTDIDKGYTRTQGDVHPQDPAAARDARTLAHHLDARK